LDWAQNAFVFLDVSSAANSTAQAIHVTRFDRNEHVLNSLGFDYFGQFWVGDARTREYHIFSEDGKYLASTFTGLFESPTGITISMLRLK
jgi:hypothetical protein